MLTTPNGCPKCQSTLIYWDNEVYDFYCNDCRNFLDVETGYEYDANADREHVYAASERGLL
jgi:transcription initiation factor TFIIIB Brf1 subunit/transcription initiation factor TFIIB